jgi:hypothetical protein
MSYRLPYYRLLASCGRRSGRHSAPCPCRIIMAHRGKREPWYPWELLPRGCTGHRSVGSRRTTPLPLPFLPGAAAAAATAPSAAAGAAPTAIASAPGALARAPTDAGIAGDHQESRRSGEKQKRRRFPPMPPHSANPPTPPAPLISDAFVAMVRNTSSRFGIHVSAHSSVRCKQHQSNDASAEHSTHLRHAGHRYCHKFRTLCASAPCRQT